MMKSLGLAVAAAVGLALSVPSSAFACEHDKKAEGLKKVTATELAALQKDQKVSVYDANGADTRKKFGVIPGATLLTSASSYDVSKELNPDKGSKLVFYCGSEKCTSAEQAATRAVEAGYSDVSVYPGGIKGWTKAGQKTSPVPNS